MNPRHWIKNGKRIPDWEKDITIIADGLEVCGMLHLYDPRNGDGEEVTILIAGEEMPCRSHSLEQAIITEYRQYLREQRYG